jgi:hypothetical protein
MYVRARARVCVCVPSAAVVAQSVNALYAFVQLEDLLDSSEETPAIGPYTKKTPHIRKRSVLCETVAVCSCTDQNMLQLNQSACCVSSQVIRFYIDTV